MFTVRAKGRYMKTARLCAALAGLAITAATAAAGQGVNISATRQGSTALAAYPGAQVLVQDGKVVSIFGVPMTAGQTPAQAADQFWARHAADFGAGALDLRPTRSDVLSNGSTALAYEQYLANLPVDRGLARVVVHQDGNRVTLASGRFAVEPAEGFAPMHLTAAQAIASVRDAAAYAALTQWSEPSLVVYDPGLSGLAPHATIAWKFNGRSASRAQPTSFDFFVDASTGVMLEARTTIHTVDITGKVQGKATTGLKPDSASNPPVARPLEQIRVKGPTTVESNALGDYLLPYGGVNATNITVGLNDGHWVRVVDTSGTAVLSLTQSVTPPGPGDFLLNNSPSEFTTAQVNAFIGTTSIHNFFKSRAPSFTGLDVQLPANVNIDSSCNAYFDGGSINFFRNQGGCANTAYADVVSHEYGHFIVQQLGLNQNAFGEGYGDSVGVLLHDTGVIGQDFCGPGCNVRNIDGANKQYPCNGEIHDCGQVLAGCWRDLRLKLTDKYGSAPAREVASQILVDWSLITVGEQNGSNGAWPQTAIEAATVDDNDGNLLNGSPNYAELSYAFGKHGISMPVIRPVNFVYPAGRPSTGSANTPVLITADIQDGSEHTISNTAQVLYRFHTTDAYTPRNLTKGSNGLYTGSIPGSVCGTIVEYKLAIKTTETPAGYIDPPTGAYTYQVVSSGPVSLADDFEGTTTFTISGTLSLGIQGRWMQADPNGTTDNGNQVAPEDDTSGGGSKCFVTGNGPAGGGASAADIDGGDTILTSPAFSLVGVSNPAISYQRWFYNNNASDANNYLIVELSNNNGTSWTQVEKLTGLSAGGWKYKEFDPTGILPATASMKLRFRAADKSPDDLVEAGVDDFRVFSVVCSCPADFDKSGFVDTDDFDAFVHAFELGGIDADFDQSGFVDTDDIDAYVAAFTMGC